MSTHNDILAPVSIVSELAEIEILCRATLLWSVDRLQSHDLNVRVDLDNVTGNGPVPDCNSQAFVRYRDIVN